MKFATCHPDRKHKAKGLCVACYAQTRAVYNAEWYQKNKERVTAVRRAYLEANPERRKETSKKHYLTHRPRKMARIYNISVEKAAELLAIKACQVCGEPATDIDHNHATAQVRGRLCTNCNNGLGRFKDNPALLRAAADYLEKAA